MAERDFVVSECPIVHEGATLVLEWSEEGANRFVTEQSWLVAIPTTKFPDEHWTADGIQSVFLKVATVVKVDGACLTGDTSSV